MMSFEQALHVAKHKLFVTMHFVSVMTGFEWKHVETFLRVCVMSLVRIGMMARVEEDRIGIFLV